MMHEVGGEAEAAQLLLFHRHRHCRCHYHHHHRHHHHRNHRHGCDHCQDHQQQPTPALAMLSGQGRSASSQQTHEMTVPNELIGCIIGKGGSKVAEIRSVLIQTLNQSTRELQSRFLNNCEQAFKVRSCKTFIWHLDVRSDDLSVGLLYFVSGTSIFQTMLLSGLWPTSTRCFKKRNFECIRSLLHYLAQETFSIYSLQPVNLSSDLVSENSRNIFELRRQLSGAMIRISNCEDRDAPANLDRTISITGNTESVALAQYLINMR